MTTLVTEDAESGNPYREKIDNFPERIFELSNSADRALLPGIVSRFGNKFLEIGSGSGNHLIELARRHPDACCIGMEFRFKRVVRTIEKSNVLGVQNTFVCRGDGSNFPSYFPSIVFDGLFVNFPDPWEKRRYRKKRMLNQDFLLKSLTVLGDGGFLSFKTDHQEYFHSFLKDIDNFEAFELISSTKDFQPSDDDIGSIATEFEMMFRSENKPICHLIARKKNV